MKDFGTKKTRGRPRLQMTPRRKQVLAKLREFARDERGVTLKDLAISCGLYDYRHARRIVKALRDMGLVR